jgi:hypothetical protein
MTDKEDYSKEYSIGGEDREVGFLIEEILKET